MSFVFVIRFALNLADRCSADERWIVSGYSDPDARIVIENNGTLHDTFWRFWDRFQCALPDRTDLCFSFVLCINEKRSVAKCTDSLQLVAARDLTSFGELSFEQLREIAQSQRWHIGEAVTAPITFAYANTT